MNYKDLIAQALASGESMESIMEKITDQANEAKKEYDEAHKAPWATAAPTFEDVRSQLNAFYAGTASDNEMLDIYLVGIVRNHPELKEYNEKDLRESYANMFKTLDWAHTISKDGIDATIKKICDSDSIEKFLRKYGL